MTEKKLESKFNNILLGIVDFVGNCFPQSWFGKNKELIRTIIEKRSEEPIAYFLEYIYKNDLYRTKLRDMDESFFLEQDFSEITKNNSKYIAKIFDFKELWLRFDEESKVLIKKLMFSLLTVSEKYINTLYNEKIVKATDNIFIKKDISLFDSISIGSNSSSKSNSNSKSKSNSNSKSNSKSKSKYDKKKYD